MRASEVLQKCLPNSLSGMHALRQRSLLRAVEALLHGGRLTLIDLARAWPGATRVRAPLKACDRLTLATFASWLAGLGCEATGIARWPAPRSSTRKLYSTLRVGRAALVGHWPMEPVSRWLDRLRTLHDTVREQMTLVL